MAVVAIEKGRRLRINDAIELVILDVCDGSVKIGMFRRPGYEE